MGQSEDNNFGGPEDFGGTDFPDMPIEVRPTVAHEEYRMLEAGEVLQEGDEYDTRFKGWVPTDRPGVKVDRQDEGRYRRRILPAPPEEDRLPYPARNFPPETKDTNPKDAIGVSKVPFWVVPWRIIGELSLALLEGALKYGAYNWRVAGVRASVYMSATVRHMADFWEGEDIDPDSGLSHVTKAIASLTVLRDSMLHGNWVDDRPPKSAPGWVREFNELVRLLLGRYPNPKEPFTEVGERAKRSQL